VRSTLALLVLAACACAMSACAARSPQPEHPSAGGSGASGAACAPKVAGSRFREMTWSEYYARVKENAWRHSAMVIWVHPPRVHAAARSATATACN
jgi:hypothetical protein